MSKKYQTKYLHTALRIKHRLEQRHLSYLEECAQDRREGHIPHYCEHGTNRWTDYDNICGPCEDGDSLSNKVFLMAESIRQAQLFHAKLAELNTSYTLLERNMSYELKPELDKILLSAYDNLAQRYGME